MHNFDLFYSTNSKVVYVSIPQPINNLNELKQYLEYLQSTFIYSRKGSSKYEL